MKQLFRFNKQCAYGLNETSTSYFAYNAGMHNPYNIMNEESRNIRLANDDDEYFCIEVNIELSIYPIFEEYNYSKKAMLFLNLFMLRETYEENH